MWIKHWKWGYLLCPPSGNTLPLITHLSCPDIMHIMHRGHNSVVEHNVFTPCGTSGLTLVVFNDIASFRKICGGLEKGRLFVFVLWNSLSAFSTDTSCQLDVLWHDGDTLGVDGAQVGVFEESDQVSLGCFLESHHGWALESQVGLEVLGDSRPQTLGGGCFLCTCITGQEKVRNEYWGVTTGGTL